jgi:hypothetical protein
MSALLALILFRGATLRRYLLWLLIGYGSAVALWRWLDPPLLAALVLELAAFSVVVARGREVRWSANRAAAVTAIVYACLIPTQIRVPIDGDEPFYLLATESIVHDGDIDLRNQYAGLAHSATGRLDLRPQIGDPVGPHGELYSRFEPFLPLLLIPGYVAGGLPGAVAILALFGMLLVRSTLRMLEDEGIDDATARQLFPLFAFAPPVISYAARIWPEVPGAFFLVEALRGVRERRTQRWVPAIAGLVLLKLRFVLIAVVLVGELLWRRRGRRRLPLLVAVLIGTPLALLWALKGSPLNIHTWNELLPSSPWRAYASGTFGLLLDGMSGLLVQAPVYLFGVFALSRWRSMPESFRRGCIAALPYLITLVPRAEWPGGWSPPLRYIVVFTPVLLLGTAALWQSWERSSSPEGSWLGRPFSRVFTGGGPAAAALASVWTFFLTVIVIDSPWRLFHIANGENAFGEFLSTLYRSDFSRLFPSFIRLNHAAVVGSLVLAAAFLLFGVMRFSIPRPLVIPLAAFALAVGFTAGKRPSDRVEFEDAHVVHEGGDLDPPYYTPVRFAYRGGWVLHPGESLSFLALSGVWRIDYLAPRDVTLDLGAGGRVILRATGERSYGSALLRIPSAGRTTLRCIAGDVVLDGMRRAPI